MKKYEVWMEGFAATSEYTTATFLGTATANTFKEAVEEVLVSKKDWEVEKYYNPNHLSYWGCGFFDNEKEARASFG